MIESDLYGDIKDVLYAYREACKAILGYAALKTSLKFGAEINKSKLAWQKCSGTL